MPELLETIETLRSEDASVHRLFGGEGRSVRSLTSRPDYRVRLAEAAAFVAAVAIGRRPFHHLQEAMTTSDFPLFFGDIIDRSVLASYREYPSTWKNYVKVGTVPDFRQVKRFTFQGAEGLLLQVGELNEYKEAALTEAKYNYAVKKYGRKMAFSWEAGINGDLDLLNDLPVRLGRAARRSEQRFVTDLFFGTTGPDTTFFAAGNANVITSNPALSIAALQTAMTVLAAQTDSDGEPIFIEAVELVVPPALEITARNILNAVQIELNTSGGNITGLANSSGVEQRLITQNWMRSRVRLNVDPYIPLIATTNGNTSWMLVANPASGRPAAEIGYLRGHAEPEVFMKEPNARRVGGASSPMDGSFELDAIEYKVRHVFGGVLQDPKMAVASNGTGS